MGKDKNNVAAQAGDEPMRELPESWRTSDISWICHHLKEHTIFDVDRLQREWDEMKAIAIQAQVSPRATADVERELIRLRGEVQRAIRLELNAFELQRAWVEIELAITSAIATTKPGA